MSEQTPLRLTRASDNSVTGFSELLAAEFIGIDDGGTGATTASGARTALGLGIGTDIQAYDADLATIAGLTHADGAFIVSNGSAWTTESGSTARDSLGLGTSDSPTFTNLTLSNDLTVTGDLTVQGDTTTINTATVTVEDVLMKLGSGNTVDTVDLGWYGEYVESSTTKYLGFTWDASADKFILWTGNQSEPNTLVDTGATGHATGTLIANIEGNVTGTLSATSTLADGVVATTQSAGDSSTKVATTAYVDTAVASEDTLAEMNDVSFGTLASGDVLRYNGSVWINDPIDLATDTVGNFVEDVTAGDGLAKTSSASEGQTVDLSVNVDDSSIEISSDSLQVKASGITNAMLAGSIDNTKLSNSSVTINANALSLGGTLTLVTDDIAEDGSPTNLYFTDARANSAIDTRVTKSFVDALNVDADTLDGNDSTAFATAAQGTLADSALQSGDNISELVNNSNFIDLTDLSGTSGVTYDNTTGQISIGQAVGTTDNVTFNDVTVDGTLNSDDVTATTMTVSNDLVVTGDLTVSGTTTTLNTDTVSTEENMIKLASGNIGNGTDIGIYGKVVQSSTTKYVGLHWDPGTGQNKFKLFDSLTVEPGATVDTADASYTTATLVADIEGDVTGNITGNVTGNVTGNLTGDVTGDLTGNVTATSVLADGVTATTQSAGDNSTKVATTAYVDAQVATEDTLAELNDTNITSPADGALLFYDTGTSMWIDNVVSGDITIADTGVASVSQSAVTQHQAALSITESQISDLQSYLTAETNDLSSAVTWANVPDANITESSVTQHEAALSITESQISDLGSYITATSSDTLTGKTINFEDNTAIIEFAVTVSNPGSGNKYYLDTELSANIQLIPGVTYRFDQSNSSNSGHPLVFSTTSESAGVTSYTTGVTQVGTPGSAGAYTQIVVDGATADKLYYYCSNHSGMGGGIVSVQGISLVAGTGISISGETISTTITQYADSDVEAYLSGTSGVTFSNGVISIGQAVGTSDNVTFNDVTISGNLDVNGTTTTIDTTNTTVTDSIIELANGTTGTPANDAGLVIERGTADNAFIGFDESADKFIVGTGTFTGSSTGNLTISTGTLVANLEGTVPQSSVTAHEAALSITESQISDLQSYLTTESNDLTSAVTWANVPDANITATSVRQHITGGDGITFSSGQIDVDSTVITGQSTYSGTVDTTNDFVLLYDASSTSLTKIAVSDLNSASGAGTMTSFNIAGDSGSNQVVADSNTLTIAGGTGIDTSIGGTDTVTIDIDSSVITTSSSIGDLTDVDITTSAPSNGQALVWNATNSEFEPGTVASSTNVFQTIAVSGQSDVVADSTSDTLTFAAGTGMTIATDASTDTITLTASSGGGVLPVDLTASSGDSINLSSTSQSVTSFEDNDSDTLVEVERTTDNDTVHVKAGGTDVITATSSGVTITNLTVTGTTTQANELKITDTLFELNADGGSLTTDAGMIVERGSTGENAAFIWDESADSWVAGTTTTDGSAASSLSYTEGTLKAATQSQGDNSTNVATTAYVDTATAGISSDSVSDGDNDTKIQVDENGSDEDKIRYDVAGTEVAVQDAGGIALTAAGGVFQHNQTQSGTYTIASGNGTVMAGPITITGTVTNSGTMVIL